MADLLDNYSESNQSTVQSMRGGSVTGVGQAFAVSLADRKLDSCKFYLKKVGSPTGNIVAKLYSHTGTYPTSSLPDTLLATSDAVSITTLTTSSALITFTFSGAERIDLSTTNYVITCEYSGGDASNLLQAGYDETSPTHGGIMEIQMAILSGAWGTATGQDLCFYVYGASPAGKGGLTLLNVG